MSFNKLMDKKLTVWQKVRTADGMGGFTETLTASVKNHPCRIDAKSGSERSMSGSVGVASTHIIFCRELTVANSDIITIDKHSGVEYLVTFVDRDLYIRGVHHYEIDVLVRDRSG